MKTKYLVVASVVLLTPFITQAVWWNPSTWTKAPVQPAAVIEAEVTPSPVPTQTVEVDKIVEKIVEKPVEKVVYRDKLVTDKTAIDENILLKAKIAELEASIKDANSKLQMCSINLGQAEDNEDDCNDAKIAYKGAKDKRFEIDRLKNEEIEKAKGSGGTTAGVSSRIFSITQRYAPLIVTSDLELKTATTEVELFCN